MPGINTTGRPSTQDITLGRGRILFAELDPTTKKPLGFRHLGNATAFGLSVETQTLEHKSSRTGVQTVDRELILSQKCGVSITLDSLNFDNWALYLNATKTAAEVNPARTTVTNVVISNAAYKGMHYELRNASGDRLMDIGTGSLSVRRNTGTPVTLTEGTDYEVDDKWGTIFLLSTGTHVDGQNLDFSYTTAANEKAIDSVNLMTVTKVSGFLRFVLINAANSDKEQLLDLHSVSLRADGELGLISDEFATMTFTGTAERNEVGYPDAPVGKLYYHADA